MEYVRPMRPSHHADESILQVHLRQVRELGLGTPEATTTYSVHDTIRTLTDGPSECQANLEYGIAQVTTNRLRQTALSDVEGDLGEPHKVACPEARSLIKAIKACYR
jgi:hypothetical protein